MPDDPSATYRDALPLKVLIVDDEELVRLGLRSVLEGAPGIAVVGEAQRATEAAELVDALEPDVVVLVEP